MSLSRFPAGAEAAHCRHCEEPEGRRSNPESEFSAPGLLRFARNDESNQLLVQVLPIGIHRFNQCEFLLSRSSLDLLFASDGIEYRGMKLIPDKYFAAVLLGEPADDARSVLPSPLRQIRSDTGIERPVSAIRHDVDCWLFPHHFQYTECWLSSLRGARRATKQSREGGEHRALARCEPGEGADWIPTPAACNSRGGL
jgi:hypothetical protein